MRLTLLLTTLASLVLAPAGTPKEIVDKLQRDMAEVLHSPEGKQKMADIGFIPVGSTPEQLTAKMSQEIPKWAALLKDAPK